MKHKLLFTSCLSIICLLFAQAVGFAAESVQLRYKFQKGETQTYRVQVNQSSEITSDMVPGATKKMSIRTDVELAQKILDVKDGSASIEMGFNKFLADQVIGGKRQAIDGTEGIKKIRLGLQMSQLGQMFKATLLNPDEIDEPARLAADSMRRSITQNSIVLPEKALSPGDSWKIEKVVPANLPGAKNIKMKLTSAYTLLSFEKVAGKACAKIQTEVSLTLKGKAEQAGVPIEADLSGSGKGVSLFAVDSGCVLNSQAKLQISGDIKATSQGQKVKTHVKVDLEIRMAKK
ncbi:MAG: hypothetical protein JRJ19_12845 [Deltaproteobacteria bacterium]|nr:hypothetical protein [Deltaproteobacteria bacterium]MBW1872950.1 hypothetical protein [Deltaproteobacteria bacterium]